MVHPTCVGRCNPPQVFQHCRLQPGRSPWNPVPKGHKRQFRGGFSPNTNGAQHTPDNHMGTHSEVPKQHYTLTNFCRVCQRFSGAQAVSYHYRQARDQPRALGQAARAGSQRRSSQHACPGEHPLPEPGTAVCPGPVL